MSAPTSHVFASCVFVPGEHGASALAHAHELVAEFVDAPRHVFIDELAWDAPSPREALRAARRIRDALGNTRLVLAIGEVEARATYAGEDILLSEASRRVSTLARASEAPGLFATRGFLDACDETDRADLVTTSTGELFELVAREARPWGVLGREARLETCLSLVEGALDAITNDVRVERLQELDARQDQVMSTMTECAEYYPAECARILVGLSRWLRPLWMRTEALDVCAALCDAPEGLDRPLLDGLRLLRGMQLRKLLEFDAAIEVLGALAHDAGAAPRERALAAIEWGTSNLAKRDVERGREGYEHADGIGEDHGLDEVRSYAHRGLAVVEMMAADGMSAQADSLIHTHLEFAIELAHRAGDRQEMMLAIGERAAVLSTSDWSLARERMLSVLELARRLHVSHHTSVALGVLADLALRRGRLVEASQYMEESRQALVRGDDQGAWSLALREGLLSLFVRDIDRADEALTTLTTLTPRLEHPQFRSTTREFALLLAVASRRTEKVRRLRVQRDRFHVRWTSICALADALLTPEEDRDDALDALVTTLREEGGQGRYHDEWFELIWRLAVTTFPHELTARRRGAMIAVSACSGWFIGADGGCVELKNRKHLHRIFGALVAHHERCEAGGLSTFELFELGWPGEKIAFSAMKNRVYVGISNLRRLGLKPWLSNGPDGYRLSPELSVVRLREA